MTSINQTRPVAGDRVFGANIGAAVTAVVGRLAQWNDARVTRKALSKLSDRELDDIGLRRGDIEDIR